jgi:hypothetical protein
MYLSPSTQHLREERGEEEHRRKPHTKKKRPKNPPLNAAKLEAENEEADRIPPSAHEILELPQGVSNLAI